MARGRSQDTKTEREPCSEPAISFGAMFLSVKVSLTLFRFMGKVRQPVKIPSMFYSICRPTVPRGCFFFKEGRGGRDVGEKGKKRRLGIPYRLVDCGVVVHILSNFILLVIWCSLRVSLLYTRHWAMSSACCFIDIFTRPVTQPQE